jgi:hypothetical protein
MKPAPDDLDDLEAVFSMGPDARLRRTLWRMPPLATALIIIRSSRSSKPLHNQGELHPAQAAAGRPQTTFRSSYNPQLDGDHNER